MRVQRLDAILIKMTGRIGLHHDNYKQHSPAYIPPPSKAAYIKALFKIVCLSVLSYYQTDLLLKKDTNIPCGHLIRLHLDYINHILAQV